MSLPQRIINSVRSQGLEATFVKARGLVSDYWFDFRYGLDTCARLELNRLTITSQNKARGYEYQPTRVMPLRRLFGAIRSLLPPDAVLVDFGSGKGRVLLVASEFGFREARGIEFAHELCEISRKNCARYKSATGTETEFKTVEEDASKYAINGDECVFVMSNPFDDIIMKSVLANIAMSVHRHPRQVFIVYYNPKWGQVIEQQTGFTLIREFNWWEPKFALYSNRKHSAN